MTFPNPSVLAAAPGIGPLMMLTLATSKSPSASTSLAVTFTLLLIPWLTLIVSDEASGASSVLFTVTNTVSLSH